MTMTKQERQQKVDEFVKTIRSFLKSPWRASESFGLSLSGHSTDIRVMVYRCMFDELYRATPKEARATFRREWIEQGKREASEIKSILSNAGYSVAQDLTDLYVQIPTNLRG